MYAVLDGRTISFSNPIFHAYELIARIHNHEYKLHVPAGKQTVSFPYHGKRPSHLELELRYKDKVHNLLIDTFYNVLRKVIYIDYEINWNNPVETIKQAVDAGYTILNLAFYIGSGPNQGPADMAIAWAGLTKDKQAEAIRYAEDRGAKILVSAGGATDNDPYLVNPVTYASNVCNWALSNGLHGVDFDLEHIEQGFRFKTLSSSDLYNWFRVLYETARGILGSDRLISHAPQAPYLAKVGMSGTWPGVEGGYVRVFNEAKQDGVGINFLNIQFYNQGNFYTSYQDIFTQANSQGFPFSAINQLGLPLDCLLYGTYLQSQDGSGFHDPQIIKGYLERAQTELGWNGGTMLWMWRLLGSPTAPEWINIVF